MPRTEGECAKAVSIRKDALIVLLIAMLCMLLFLQLVPSDPPGESVGKMAAAPPDAEADAAQDEARPEIRLAMDVHLPEESFRRLNGRLEQMSRAFPHVRVDAANFPRDGAQDRLLEAAGRGELADIVMLDLEWAGRFAARGHLARWPGDDRPAADPVQLLTGWNGYRWVAAYETDPYVVAYGGSLEAAAPGESLPRSLEEWARLRDAPAAEDGAGGLIYADPDDPGAFISLVLAMGGDWERAEGGMIVPGESGTPVLELLFGHPPAEGASGAGRPLMVTQRLEREEMWRRFSDGTLPIVIVPFSELYARGLAHRQIAGLVDTEETGTYWIRGTGLAVSSSSGAADEAFEWLETFLAGHAPAAAGRWTERMADVFGGDPELPDKLDALRAALPALYAGETPADRFAEALKAAWPAPEGAGR